MAAGPVLSRMIGIEDLAVIRHLETAFEEETKISTTYRAYAARADEEDYHGIASLFRAIARAEQIHAANHARVLRHMNGLTGVKISMPRVESPLRICAVPSSTRDSKLIISTQLFSRRRFHSSIRPLFAPFTGLWKLTSRMFAYSGK